MTSPTMPGRAAGDPGPGGPPSPIDYARPNARPTRSRRSRRLRREAAKLLAMTVVLAVATAGTLAYDAATTGVARDGRDDSLIRLAALIGLVTAMFAVATAMQYLRSRADDRAEQA
jgi:hypothetical protein